MVDDEPDILAVFKRSLEKEGFEVQAYADPLQALKNFKPNYFDLLVFDFKMRDLNGFELFKRIKDVDMNAKVCFLSADEHHYREYQDSMPQLSAGHFLHKPIALQQFVNRIKNLLQT